MKNYSMWIIGGLVSVAVIALLWSLIASPSKSPTPNADVTLPVAGDNSRGGTLPTNTNNTFSIPASSGVSIQTKDFLKDPATVSDPINTGHYYLGYHEDEGVPDPTVTANPPYVIEYIASTNFFIIVLQQEPLGVIRRDVEAYLMTHLGISQDQMCELKYQLGVPSRVNAQYAGTDLRFSFCPGATVLPK